ncbi:MAG: EAL domain-containing protein [Candidatus Competibacter sp.]|nr:EAL domain-containing protein [Candidatus Competibacter sp.]MDG4583818.1 EAL domain-containing protein [Candidatus Competibacter sp.]
MPKPSEPTGDRAWELLRDQIIGLGERSFRKSYYPELRRNLWRLERFRALLDFAGDMVLLIALPDGEMIDANAAAAEIFGQPLEALIGRRFGELGLDRATEILTSLVRDTVGAAPLRRIEATVRSRSRSIPLDLTYRIAELDGRRYGVLLGRDARARIAAEARLRLAERVFDDSGEGIVVADTQGRIVEVNRAGENITGYRRAELEGQSPERFAIESHDPGYDRNAWAMLRAQGYWQGEIWSRRKNGEVFPVWLSVSAIRDEKGVVCHYVAMFSDISASKAHEARRKADEARIQHMAHHDFLTGLPNRLLLEVRFGQLLTEARRRRKRFALLFIDLDRFKNINDTFGHGVGDRLLCGVAARLSALVRATDTVSRQGGDEFVVLLSEIGGPDDAVLVARKLLRELGEPCVLEGHDLTVTPSIGIAVAPDDGESLETLLKHADLAMYEAKRQGRNNYQFFQQEMNARTLERLLLENRLRQALKQEEFELFYQPQVDLETGRMVAFEALLRWRHPERGLVLPMDFLPLAEETGLILPMGVWVLREVCRQVAAWRRGPWPEIRATVNLSALQFRQPALIEQLRSALADAEVEAEAIELEVAEGVAMQDAGATVHILRALRAMGVTLAIDNFGTGYSSLAYLKQFPVSVLKIDRSFVGDIGEDIGSAAICAAVIGLARNLGLDVVAEGVETDAQIAWLRAAGCCRAQGFLLGAPLPAAGYATGADLEVRLNDMGSLEGE